jgi:hypothetical protein
MMARFTLERGGSGQGAGMNRSEQLTFMAALAGSTAGTSTLQNGFFHPGLCYWQASGFSPILATAVPRRDATASRPNGRFQHEASKQPGEIK